MEQSKNEKLICPECKKNIRIDMNHKVFLTPLFGTTFRVVTCPRASPDKYVIIQALNSNEKK